MVFEEDIKESIYWLELVYSSLEKKYSGMKHDINDDEYLEYVDLRNYVYLALENLKDLIEIKVVG